MDGITFRGYLLEYLYSIDYRYIIKDNYGEIYAVDAITYESGQCVENGKYCKNLIEFCKLFEDVKCSKPLNIACEIGAIDWATVPDDTPVLVRNFEHESWYRRHFCKYNTKSDSPFQCYREGLSKHTIKEFIGENKLINWAHCKLAEDGEQ